MKSAPPPLLCEFSGHLATITFNRPERRNALSIDMLQRLQAVLQEISEHPDVRVVVLQAMGPVFCSGHDLTEMTHRNREEFTSLFALCSEVMQRLRGLSQPVIAEVRGLATAAGCQLVAACDLAIAGENATFATPGVRIGLFCSTPMVPLVRAIPAKAAMEMLLTGTPIDAQRACQLGLVNRVVAADDLTSAVRELADRISAFSPEVVSLGKQVFYDTLQQTETEAYERACRVMARNAMLDDAHEGMTAFLEKRSPEWSGR